MAPCNFEGIPDLTDSCGKVSGVFLGYLQKFCGSSGNPTRLAGRLDLFSDYVEAYNNMIQILAVLNP